MVSVKPLFGLDLSGMGFSFRRWAQAQTWAVPPCEPGESRGPSLSHCSGLIPSPCEASAAAPAGRPGCGRAEGVWCVTPAWPTPQTHPDPGTRSHTLRELCALLSKARPFSGFHMHWMSTGSQSGLVASCGLLAAAWEWQEVLWRHCPHTLKGVCAPQTLTPPQVT